MYAFLISGLRSGLRGRSFHAVFLLGIALIGIAYLSGSFSPRQPRTVALDVGFSGLRFTLVLLTLFWTQELVTREIDRKIVLFSLAYPVPRASFVLGRYAAVVILNFLATLVFGCCLMLATLLAGGEYWQQFPVALGLPFWLTLLGLFLDAAVVASVAVAVATVSTVALLPLATAAGFAIAGKALGATMDFILTGAGGDQQMVASFGPTLTAIRWIVPDLSRLDWREWPMYGMAPDPAAMAWSGVMGAAYAAMLLGIAVLAFRRREFS